MRNEEHECPIRDAFERLGIKGLDIILTHTATQVDRVLYELHRLEGDGPGEVARLLFGTACVNEVLSLASDVFEDVDFR